MVTIGREIVFLLLFNLVVASRPSSEFKIRTGGADGDTRSNSRRLLQGANSTCPLDFSWIENYTWIKDVCAEGEKNPACCTAALSGMGLGLAKYLKLTGTFHLPSLATAEACLGDFRLQLQQTGLQRDIVAECFEQAPTPNNYSASTFIYNPMECQAIYSVNDFRRVANASGATAIDSSCRSTLYDAQCSKCITDMWDAIKYMTTLNSTTAKDCFAYVCTYVAGVVNIDGPWEAHTAACIFAVPFDYGSHRSKVGLYIGIVVAIAFLVILAGVSYGVWQQRKATAIHREFIVRNNSMLHSSGSSLLWFNWTDLKAATQNFSRDSLLGEGSYGSVYKATFKDGRTLAVKQFRNCTPEGDAEFLNEVEALVKLKHKNLVNLQGCCIASNRSVGHQRLLVYDYMRNRSLADYLFSSTNPTLTWTQRQKIAIGMAQGLAYLHTDAKPQIIHRDIKASNILLDDHLDVHVADFGLAKLAPEEDASLRTSHIMGTLGYVAPEYALYGQLTEMSDVYSFGVCLLELLSNRPALLNYQEREKEAETPTTDCFITEWAWSLLERNCALDVIDERIRHTSNHHASVMMERFVMVAILCTHVMVSLRPSMTEALRMLEGHREVAYDRVLERPLLPLSSKASDLVRLLHYEALESPIKMDR